MNDVQLEQVYRSGIEAWPSIRLDWTSFRNHAQPIFDSKFAAQWQKFSHDLFLCAACCSGNLLAIELFDKRLIASTGTAIRRINANESFVDDVRQVLRQKLLLGPNPRLRTYAARGPLSAWLGISATRIALDIARSRKGGQERRLELSEHLFQQTSEPLKNVVRSRYREEFQQALQAAIRQLPARERNVLRLHIVSRCNIDQLGVMYHVNRTTTARWLQRGRQKILDSIRQSLGSEHNWSDSEFFSIARGLQSQLDVQFESNSFSAKRSSPSDR